MNRSLFAMASTKSHNDTANDHQDPPTIVIHSIGNMDNTQQSGEIADKTRKSMAADYAPVLQLLKRLEAQVDKMKASLETQHSASDNMSRLSALYQEQTETIRSDMDKSDESSSIDDDEPEDSKLPANNGIVYLPTLE